MPYTEKNSRYVKLYKYIVFSGIKNNTIVKKRIICVFFQKILAIFPIKCYDNRRTNITEGGVP